MSSLTDRLRERIRNEGAISFHDFMTAALYDAEGGYYCRNRQIWGRAGDYRTSPERSVLFAATFAHYFVDLFHKLGSPADCVLIEAGAGSGQFAEGVLDTLRFRAPAVFKATRYLIDERSSSARALVKERLGRFGHQIEFAQLVDLPSFPVGIVFSNELLDAFPVHRVTVRAGELAEFFVTLNEGEEFVWTIQKPSSTALEHYFRDAGISLVEGQIAEVNLGIKDWLTQTASAFERGYMVTVDYGAEAAELFSAVTRPHGTLRGFREQKFVADVLASPGEQDITSSVNWSEVIRVGEAIGLKKIAFERQDRFLVNAGLLEELELRVSETSDEAEKLRLRTGARELILPSGMAASFQVLVQEKLG